MNASYGNGIVREEGKEYQTDCKVDFDLMVKKMLKDEKLLKELENLENVFSWAERVHSRAKYSPSFARIVNEKLAEAQREGS